MIIRNAIRTPDGTILVSRHRHDFVGHTDSVTGHYYAIDGGRDYLKRSTDSPEPDVTELSVYHTAAYEDVREAFTWGSSGPNGADPMKFIPLKELTDDHIQNIMRSQNHMPSWMKWLFRCEIGYRAYEPIVFELIRDRFIQECDATEA